MESKIVPLGSSFIITCDFWTSVLYLLTFEVLLLKYLHLINERKKKVAFFCTIEFLYPLSMIQNSNNWYDTHQVWTKVMMKKTETVTLIHGQFNKLEVLQKQYPKC